MYLPGLIQKLLMFIYTSSTQHVNIAGSVQLLSREMVSPWSWRIVRSKAWVL